MLAIKLLASAMLFAVTGFAFTQESASPSVAQRGSQDQSAQTSSQQSDVGRANPYKKDSTSRRATHRIQVPVEDAPSQSPELARAEAAIEKQDYTSARVLLRKVVEKEPDSYAAWFDLGFTENALGNVDASIEAYRKSVNVKSDVFESNLNLGLQLAKTGQSDAETFLRAATKLKPTSHTEQGHYRAWISLGQVLEKSRPEEALAAYQEAATAQPKESSPHLYAGEILEQENKFAEAEQEYKQALALDPESMDAATGLANIYLRGRRFPEAEEYLRKLLAQHGDSGQIHLQLGRVLAAEDKTEAAIAEMQAGIKLTPDDEASRRELADLYVKGGKNELAEATYRELAASHPNDADLHRRLGEALLPQKKFAEAQAQFGEAVKLKPDLGEAYGGLAFAAGENKNFPLVIHALDERGKLLPETAITYFMRASAYDHLHDFKKASANYRLFLNQAQGKYPDQEWQAEHRLIAIEPKR